MALVKGDEDQPYCSTCRMPVMIYTNAAGEVVEVLHARVDIWDHDPVLISLKDLPNPRQFCDFCSAEGPQWRFRTKNEIWFEATESRVDNLGTTWLLCDTCMVHVENRNMEGLLDRVISTFRSANATPENIRSVLEPVYARLFAEMGEIEPNPKGPK